MKPKVIIIIVLSIITLLFIFLNTEVVGINFIIGSFEMSKIVLILFSLVIGLIIGYFLGNLFEIKKKEKSE